MNAAAAAKLEELIRGQNPVHVMNVTLRPVPMTLSLVREAFGRGKNFEMNEEGVGVQLPSGDWLWVGAQPQPGGLRA